MRAREKVAVFGDYDVDGTTSATILSDVLEAVGGDVRALVANRYDGGYGFSDAALARCLDTSATLVVTCDCGSSDHERIEEAKARGVDVVVIDHHLVPAEPLPALAFFNPHRPECGFPYKGLASAGLAFSIGAALRTALDAKIDLKEWLDLVALGTIADVAPLDGDNRRLVRAGLVRLSEPLWSRPGVRALCETAKVLGTMGAADVAFRLAPRLNAAGRLGDPTITLELLRSTNVETARGLAARIEQINEERKQVERRVTEEALAQAREVYGPTPEAGVVVAGEGWNRGVVGISAARLVDALGVPAIVIALESGVGHGSGRATPGFRLHGAISRARSELVAFGGHDAAAGLTLRRERLEAFRAGFFDASKSMLESAPGVPTPMADVALDGLVFAPPRSQEVLMLEPVGERNAEPLYVAPAARVERAQAVGEDGAHLKLVLRIGPVRMRGFGRELGHLAATLPQTVDALGHIRLDSWLGGDAVEMRVVSIG